MPVTVNGPAIGQSGAVSGAGNGPQLLTVTIGNSINNGVNASGTTRNNNAGANPLGWWMPYGEIGFARSLAGDPLIYPRITASTRADKWGQYAYSGATLATINSDLSAQLYGALDTAGVQPDLIIGVALLENDIGVDATYAQCVSRLNAWLYTAQGRYPTARIAIACPRPSYSYSTPARVLVYQQMRDYTLALDDGQRVFAVRMDWYENPAAPGTPLAGYTDATVHPTNSGASMNARMGWLPLLSRIIGAGLPAYRCASANFALTGSASASGTGLSGTAATGVVCSGAVNGAWVLTANDPGQQCVISQSAGQLLDIGTIHFGATTVSGFTRYAPYIKLRVDSGAENLRALLFQSRFNDGATNVFFNLYSISTSDPDPVVGTGYRNGDVITLRYPPMIQADVGSASAWSSITNYLRPVLKTGGTANGLGGACQITVLDSGIGLVS